MISRCTGVILAGGANARFRGAHKGLVEVDGRRVVDRVVDALRPTTDELLLIANDEAVWAAIASVPARADVRRERGSLVGIHTALAFCADAALVVAWDMPFVSSALLSALRCRGEKSHVAVIPEGARGLEPLCAYYPKSALGVAERQLDAGELRVSAFVEALPHCVILSQRDVSRFGVPKRLFVNVNSAADLIAARSMAAESDDTRDAVDRETASLSDFQ
jgi:molybdopterin-guanine dinucleotide biosynthesis protein A